MKSIIRSLGTVTQFFIPRSLEKVPPQNVQRSVAAVIPTFDPTEETCELITSLLKHNASLLVILVDDCTPRAQQNAGVYRRLEHINTYSSRFHFVRTSKNRFKAGAINRGLEYMQEARLSIDAVVICDDDVCISPTTIPNLIKALYTYKNVAAVCPLFHVKNKNKNLITRLQALEYHGFNISKIADNSFLLGPLVVQGVLGAFRYDALLEISGFAPGHLIEDYDVTVRLKRKGYHVIAIDDNSASTIVPESFKTLWKQRVRWSYGGIHVIRDHHAYPLALFQDLFGHSVYIVLFALIVLSFLLIGDGAPSDVPDALLFASFVQFVVAYIFSVATLRSFRNADVWDYLIKLSVLPELLYATVFCFVLLGSYAFFFYNKLFRSIMRYAPNVGYIYRAGLSIFQSIGFSASWGTK